MKLFAAVTSAVFASPVAYQAAPSYQPLDPVAPAAPMPSAAEQEAQAMKLQLQLASMATPHD